MSNDFSHLRAWLTTTNRPVVLECIVSRSGLSMTVYDRGERLYSINGYGFDRIGTALGEFLEVCFQPELSRWMGSASSHSLGARAWERRIYLDGACGIESMIKVADAIGLSAQLSETKAGTLIIIQPRKVGL